MNKNKLLRLAVATPVTGGALVILMMFVTGPKVSVIFAAVAVAGLFLLGLQTWANYYRQWIRPHAGAEISGYVLRPGVDGRS